MKKNHTIIKFLICINLIFIAIFILSIANAQHITQIRQVVIQTDKQTAKQIKQEVEKELLLKKNNINKNQIPQ